MVEDALPADGAEVVQAVALLALVASRGHVCPRRGLAAVIKHFVTCLDSTDVFAFRGVPQRALRPSNRAAAMVASDCIAELRSFDGDLRMMRDFASRDVLPVNRSEQRNHVVPWYHLADHHVYPGIAHVPWSMRVDSEGRGFKGRLQEAIFRGVTGYNPRVSGAALADTPAVDEVRAAQELLMETVLRQPRVQLGVPVGTKIISVPLPPGTLSGAVGPVDITVKTTPQEDMQDDVGITKGTKWELQVVLGIANKDERVILKPLGRGSLEDPRQPPSASATAKAIQEVRRKKLPTRREQLFEPPLGWRCT